ncbi:hypothetical protein BpHYR1_043183 [Brachionus plicatilis]|uniref:Uncharacterized protein n=1 Tax=Brachionus plicatilis TaxID=10195 RepID=A0A3M7RA88_BRAPC|nr:hypothetical protein BpHYR1_043183 [Brachionus plicatilis]
MNKILRNFLPTNRLDFNKLIKFESEILRSLILLWFFFKIIFKRRNYLNSFDIYKKKLQLDLNN